MGTNYTNQQIQDLWVQNGGNPATAGTAAAVALGESSGNQYAENLKDPNGGSVGLFQINRIHGDQASFDLNTNVKAAVALSNNGTNWKPWGAYTDGSYQKYLDPNTSPDGRTVAPGDGNSPTTSPAQTTADLLAPTTTAQPVAGTTVPADFITELNSRNLQRDDRLDETPWFDDTGLLTGNPRARKTVQPVSFTVFLDRQQPNAVLHNPRTNAPVQLQLNCSLRDFAIESRHIFNRTPSRTGMHVTFWGMAPDLITGSGSTGVFLNQLGITDWFSTANVPDDVKQAVNKGFQNSGGFDTAVAKNAPNSAEAFRVAAQDAFVEFMKLFQMNGIVWFNSPAYAGKQTGDAQQGPNAWSSQSGLSSFQIAARNNDVMTRGYVALRMKGRVYLGYFKSLSWTQDAEKPFSWEFNFVFQVERTFISLYYPDFGATATQTTSGFPTTDTDLGRGLA